MTAANSQTPPRIDEPNVAELAHEITDRLRNEIRRHAN
jgi:hypothetical protein